MTLMAFVALMLVPFLTVVDAAGASEAPCPHMAEMAMVDHGAHAMPMAGMTGHTMDDMDCCDDAKAMSHDSSMSGCSFACKVDCLHLMTALPTAESDIALPVPYRSSGASPPGQLIAHAVGFTTPPPRI